MIRNYKYALIQYNNTHHINYRLESFIAIALSALLPERYAEQVKYSRFVNYTGGLNCNRDGDYILEILNGHARRKINRLFSSHTHVTVDRIGKTLGFNKDLAVVIKEELEVRKQNDEHTEPDLDADRAVLVNELTRLNIFKLTGGRAHESFTDVKSSIFADTPIAELHAWITEKLKTYTHHKKWAF